MNQTKSPTTIIIIAAVVVIAIIVGALYYVQGGPSGSASRTQPDQAEQERGAAFVQKVADESVKTTSIDVSKCAPNPQQVTFKSGANVRFVNDDNVPHTISFSPDHTFTVGKNSKKYITFDFWKFPGVRKYSCDDKPAVGMVYVTNE